MRFGKQHWQKLASRLKKSVTPRSKELQRELSAVRHDYWELGLRVSALASERDLVRQSLGKAKQQIESVRGELGAAYKARDQLAFELQKQLESLKTGIKEVQVGHHGLVKGVAGRDRQLETLVAELEAHRSAEQEQRDAINNLRQRVTTAALDYTAVTEINHTLAADLEDLRNELDSTSKHPLTPSQATVAGQVFETKKFFEENARQEGVISLPSGLQYKVLRTGSGQSPGLTDMVILHYRGSLPDGREFDSSYAEKAPAA